MQVEVTLREVALTDVAAAAVRMEQAGVDVVSDAEVRRDPLLTMALIAAATEKIHLATGISIAFARSPMVYAYAARNLQDLSGGRFHLGLGTQVKRHVLRRFGAAWGSPGPRFRDHVHAIQDIWEAWQTGVALQHQSEHYTIDLMPPEFDLGPTSYPPVPIELAAVNPLNLALAASSADAVRLHVFSTPSFVRDVALPRLEEAADSAGRDPSAITVIGGGFVATGATEAEVVTAREHARRRVAFYGSTRTYRPVLEHHGWEGLGEKLRSYADEQRWDEMASLVPDDVLEEFVSSGTYDQIAEVIDQRYGGVIDRVQVPWPTAPDVAWADFEGAVARLQHRDRR